MTSKKRKSDGNDADGHVRIQRTVLRRVVCDRLQALLRGDFYVRNHLGPEDYDTLVHEVETMDVSPPPIIPRNDNDDDDDDDNKLVEGKKKGGNEKKKSGGKGDNKSSNDNNNNNAGATLTATNVIEFTPDLETFVQLIASSILIDASMRGENAGESDTRFIKKKKKMLMATLRGPRLYDFQREVLRFHRIKNGGTGTMGGDNNDDDDEILSDESDGFDSDDSGSVEEVVERRGKKISTNSSATTTSTTTNVVDALTLSSMLPPPVKSTTGRRTPPPTATIDRLSSGGESTSVDDEGGLFHGGDGSRRADRRSQSREEDDTSESGGTSSANSGLSGVEGESLTLDGFSTSATSSKHHKKSSKDKKKDKKSLKRKERKRLKKERKKEKERKRLKKEEKRRRRERKEKKRIAAEKDGGSKKRKKEYNGEDNDDDGVDERMEDANSHSSFVCGIREGGDDRDSEGDLAEQRHRSRKRKGYELATREEFDKYKSEWLGRIPKDVKLRFREGGFSKWGSDWLPVLELGPFDVEPGPVRDMWFDMFRKTMQKGRDMTRLCFWYGVKFEDRGQAYSFLPESKIVPYEEGERLEYCNMPKKIQQKIEKKSKLTKTEEQIRRGLTEIVSDMKRDKSDRIEWMMNWKEDFEYAEEEAEIQAKLARIVKEEDVPKKRGPGRPKKEEGITVLDVQVPIKRKPGRPKKSADITMPLDVEDVVVVKKRGPGRPKKADKEKFERADEKKAKKEKSSKKYEMMNVDHESDIATDDDEDDRDYHSDGDSGSDDEVDADTDDDNNSDVGVGKKRKSISSKETVNKSKKSKPFMTDEEKANDKRAKAAEYREKKRREKMEAQGLEYTKEKGKAGRKSKAALLEMEQVKFTKCEGVFKPIISQLTQARDDNDYKVAMECINSITERVEMLTPPFFRDYQLGMLVKSVRKAFEGMHPEVKDFCHRLTIEMKRVYFEKNDKVPDGFDAIKNRLATPKVKQVTSEEKDNSSIKTERVLALKSEKMEREQSFTSRHNSEVSHAESAVQRMANAASSEYIPNVVTSDPPEPRPKKAFTIKGMFDKPKPATKPIPSAPSSSSLITSGRSSTKVQKSLPSWITGPAMKKEDFHEQHIKERSFGLEFLADAASSVDTFATDKFDPTSVSQSFELAIFAETKLRGRDWHEYWERIHDIVAMLSPGENKRNAILQGIINGDYREPSELVKLSRREIQSLNQLKS